MLINIEKIVEQVKNSKINLVNTTDLKTSENPSLLFLRDEYINLKTPEGRVIASILNSLLTQNRAIFVLTRNWAQCLVKNDLNHSVSSGFSNEKWTGILDSLYNGRIIKQISPGVGRQPAVYQVVNKKILAILEEAGVDIAAQIRETTDFVQRKDCSFEPPVEVEAIVPAAEVTPEATIVPEVEDVVSPKAEAVVATEPTPVAEPVQTPETPTTPETFNYLSDLPLPGWTGISNEFSQFECKCFELTTPIGGNYKITIYPNGETLCSMKSIASNYNKKEEKETLRLWNEAVRSSYVVCR